MDLYQIIKKPIISEKAVEKQNSLNVYSFVVDRKANKLDIRRAIEKLFKVNVLSVNTSIVRGKLKRVGRNVGKKPNFKKALVALKEGQKIELFEGV